MNKKIDRKQIRTMDRILIGLLVVGLLISFAAVVMYLIPDMLTSDKMSEEKLRNCFAEVDSILTSHGIDMTKANIEEGHLFGDDKFEMNVQIDVDDNLRLDIGFYQVEKVPHYYVALYHFGEVNDTADFINIADYSYVYEVAAYLGDCYSSDSLLKAVQKQQTAAIKQWEIDGLEVHEDKQYTRFFVRMEEVGFAYVGEADDHPPYQCITIDDYVRAK